MKKIRIQDHSPSTALASPDLALPLTAYSWKQHELEAYHRFTRQLQGLSHLDIEVPSQDARPSASQTIVALADASRIRATSPKSSVGRPMNRDSLHARTARHIEQCDHIPLGVTKRYSANVHGSLLSEPLRGRAQRHRKTPELPCVGATILFELQGRNLTGTVVRLRLPVHIEVEYHATCDDDRRFNTWLEARQLRGIISSDEIVNTLGATTVASEIAALIPSLCWVDDGSDVRFRRRLPPASGLKSSR